MYIAQCIAAKNFFFQKQNPSVNCSSQCDETEKGKMKHKWINDLELK